MLKFIERKDVRTAEEAIKEIGFQFERMLTALELLKAIFMDKKWALKEGQKESVELFFKVQVRVQDCLTNIETATASLRKFSKGKPPIIINRNGLSQISVWLRRINTQISFYEKKVKGTDMPHFDIEIGRTKKSVDSINEILGRINGANAPHGTRPYSPIKSPF